MESYSISPEKFLVVWDRHRLFVMASHHIVQIAIMSMQEGRNVNVLRQLRFLKLHKNKKVPKQLQSHQHCQFYF